MMGVAVAIVLEGVALVLLQFVSEWWAEWRHQNKRRKIDFDAEHKLYALEREKEFQHPVVRYLHEWVQSLVLGAILTGVAFEESFDSIPPNEATGEYGFDATPPNVCRRAKS